MSGPCLLQWSFPYHGSQSDQAVGSLLLFRCKVFCWFDNNNSASPAFMKSGFSAATCPVFGSSFFNIAVIVPATCAVWQCKTGVYPIVIADGCCNTTIWAVNSSATHGGWLQIRKRLRVWYLFSQRLLRSIRCYRPALLLWSLVMHFYWFYSPTAWPAWILFYLLAHYSGLNSSYWNSSDTGNGVCVLDWNAKW